MNNNKPEIRDKNFISTSNSVTSGKTYEKPMTCPNCGYGTDSVVVIIGQVIHQMEYY